MTHNLVLGTMWFGTLTEERRAFELLDRYVDAGGVWLDTSDSYAFWVDPGGVGGQSETVLGRWLTRRPGARDRVRIATKVGAAPGPGPDTVVGLSGPAVRRGIEGSLRRLGTTHVDLYWTHLPDPATPPAETVEALDDLVSAGTVGRLGCSNHAVWQVERARQLALANGRTPYTAIQQHHTYLRPRPGVWPIVTRFGAVTDEVMHYLEHHPDLALWAYTPLLGGRYTREEKPLAPEYEHPGTTKRLAVLDEIAAETGTDRNQVVLAWLTGSDPAVTPVVGVSTTQQLTEVLAATNLTLTTDQQRRLTTTV